jgi:DNA-binding SARP family transcriptional activator
MKKIILILFALWLLPVLAGAVSKDDNRMKAAEQALSDKRYSDAKATIESLKDNPKYRDKCNLYLALILYDNGQIDEALNALSDFKRYTTDKTDASLTKTAENLEKEINSGYSSLEIAIFDNAEGAGVDPGF